MAAPTTLRRTAMGLFVVSLTLLASSVLLKALNAGTYTTHDPGDVAASSTLSLSVGCFAVTGLLIIRRSPHQSIGWLMSLIALILAWLDFSYGYIRYALVTDPGALPRPEILAGFNWLWAVGFGLTCTFLILLFPDGRLPSPRWRAVAWSSGLVLLGMALGMMLGPSTYEGDAVPSVSSPFEVQQLEPVLTPVRLGSFVLFPLTVLACAASLVVRFRRSRGRERLQLKWLATGVVVAAVLFLLAMTASLVGPGAVSPEPGWVGTLTNVALVSFTLIPVCIGVAILKQGLYEIDVVINKALVFGILAAFITTVYVAIVVGVGRLAGGGERPNLALSVAATAVVAVAFQPVRERVQRLANRLVYGARATPYEVLSEFADRVGGSYDAAELLPTMARTVAQGVGAVRSDVWLLTEAGLVREATWPDTPVGAEERPTVQELSDLRADRVAAVCHGDELFGALSVTKPPGEQLTPAEQRLLDDVAAQAGLVLRNVRLIEDLRGSRQRLVSTQDEARRRLERNLHDGAQQSLVAVALMLRMVRARLGDQGPAGCTLDEAVDQLGSAIEDLRELARGIHPAVLTERGLGPAIASLAERSLVPVVVDYRLDDRPSTEVEGTLYYVVAEALANVAKHAAATEARVRVCGGEGHVRLEVSDNGDGGADASNGSGLRGLVDRVSVVDGSLDIDSPARGGTQLVCTLPFAPSGGPTDAAAAETTSATPLGVAK
ncbi:MAG TPA: histidine kinase [Nocardioidaceae bacterium]